MKTLTQIGRFLYALPFAAFGINHFIMKSFYMGELTDFIPFGGYMILLTGFIMILTSIAIMTKQFVRLSSLILAGLLLIFILSIHIPQLFDPDKKIIALIALLKDTSLMGGSLMIAGMTVEKEIVANSKGNKKRKRR
jgi:putative oxidoreductase